MSVKSVKNEKTWLKFRHKIVTAVVKMVLAPYTRLKFGVTVQPFSEQGGRQYMVLYNHQTTFD